MDKKIEITVQQIVKNGVKAEYKGETKFYHKSAFLDYKNVTVGEKYKLKYYSKIQKYNQRSLLFDRNYAANNFAKKDVYEATILKRISDFYVLRIAQDKFGRIYEKDMLPNKNYQKYDCINVSLRDRTSLPIFSIFKANFKLFKEGINNQTGNYPFQIVEIEKNINKDKNITAYDIHTFLGLKIFIPIYDEFLFEENYHYIKNLLFQGENPEYNFYYNSEKERFNLSIEDSLILESNQPYIGKLIYNKPTKKYYIKTSKGYCQLHTDDLSYLEKSILKHLVGTEIPYNKDRYKVIVYKYPPKQVKALKGKVLENIKIDNVIDTKIDKRLYVADNFFMEASEYSYDDEVALIGELIDKAQVKDVLGNRFIFLTRKPYLTDPKQKFFGSKEIGDFVRGEVRQIFSQFIVISFAGKFTISILKEDLLPLEFYEIEEFYQIGETYDFYISQKEPQLKLAGYDRDKYRKQLLHYTNRRGEITEGYVYKKMITKYIIRLGNYIEAELPRDEIAYLNNENKSELEVSNKLKYDFKILDIELLLPQVAKITLSRKQLSEITYAYRREYKAGSTVQGVFFLRSKDGFYFNLQHQGEEIQGLTGFLSNEEVAFYPKLDEFHQQVINNKQVEFKIISYPIRLRKSPYLEEKSIKLSCKSLSDFNLQHYYQDLKHKTINVGQKDILQEGLDYRNQVDRIYFKRKIYSNQEVIFGLQENNFIPGINFEEEFSASVINYLEGLVDYVQKNLDTLSNKEKKVIKVILDQDELSSDLDFNFNYSGLEVDYLNRYNNTIEVNYSRKAAAEFISICGEIEIEVRTANSGNKFGYLFNKPELKLRVDLPNRNVKDGKKYKVKLVDYADDSNRLLARIVSMGQDSIGDFYPVQVIDKLSAKEYKVKYLDDKYAKLITVSKTKLLSFEYIYAQLEEVSDDVIFKYSFPTDEIDSSYDNIELQHYSLQDLLTYIKDPDNLVQVSSKIAASIYRVIKTKIDNLNLNLEIDFKDVIYLLENGFTRGKYVFDKQSYAQGNFGLIFKGLDLETEEVVVCKRYTSNREDDIERKRFELEVKLLQELDMEGIFKAYDYLPENNEYIAQYVAGDNLADYIEQNQEQGYSWKEKQYHNILIQLADILDSLALEGISHCDLKPENIIYNQTKDKVTLVDFGSVQTEDIKGGYGTIHYMSPGQCLIYSNPHLQHSSEHNFTTVNDIYSFGVMMYEMFAGRLPYTSKLEEATIIMAHQEGQSRKDCEYSFKKPSYYNRQLEPELEDIILKAMAEDPNDRYSDFYELLLDLEEV